MLLNQNRKPQTHQEDKNLKGIRLALRYLSREAKGAGLTELAKTLDEAELKCQKARETKNPR